MGLKSVGDEKKYINLVFSKNFLKICSIISANGGSKIYKEEVRDRLVDPLATNFKSRISGLENRCQFLIRHVVGEYKLTEMKGIKSFVINNRENSIQNFQSRIYLSFTETTNVAFLMCMCCCCCMC